MTTSADLALRAAAVLLDIEGTIASQTFVAEVLYPYAAERLSGFVAARGHEPEIAEILAGTQALAGHDGDPVEILKGWIAEDRKAPPLKKIQGLIWEGGYLEGAFEGHIYEDARVALEAWHAAGIPLYVFSSGSVFCQLMFFEHNVAGDLRHLFSGHWDTDIGSKVEPASYQTIVGEIGVTAEEIAFFSDNPRELVAARDAGLQVVHVVRETTEHDGRFPEISDFTEVDMAEV